MKCKWVFKIKPKTTGIIDQYEVRLVAKRRSQKYGIGYQKTYAFVNFDSIKECIPLRQVKILT